MKIDTRELIHLASLARQFQGRIQQAHEARDYSAVYACGHTVAEHLAERLEAIVGRAAGVVEITEDAA